MCYTSGLCWENLSWKQFICVRNERPCRVSHSTVHPRPSLPLPGAASRDHRETGEVWEVPGVQTTMLFAFRVCVFISLFFTVDQMPSIRLVLESTWVKKERKCSNFFYLYQHYLRFFWDSSFDKTLILLFLFFSVKFLNSVMWNLKFSATGDTQTILVYIDSGFMAPQEMTARRTGAEGHDHKFQIFKYSSSLWLYHIHRNQKSEVGEKP